VDWHLIWTSACCFCVVTIVQVMTISSYFVRVFLIMLITHSTVDMDAFPPKFRPLYEVNVVSGIAENVSQQHVMNILVLYQLV
jgi:hypothetical protein